MTNYGLGNMPTCRRVRELLHYCPDTGVFVWKSSRGSVKAGQAAASKNAIGYVQIQIDGENYLGHRLAWLYVHGRKPKKTIDHINGDRGDNRISNLRDIEHQSNIQNQRKAPVSNISSGLLGVSKIGSRWRAYIRVDDRQKHIGCFATAAQAHSAYVDAKRKYHAGCTL